MILSNLIQLSGFNKNLPSESVSQVQWHRPSTSIVLAHFQFSYYLYKKTTVIPRLIECIQNQKSFIGREYQWNIQ